MKIKTKLLASNCLLSVVFVAVSCISLSWFITNEARHLVQANARDHLIASRNQTAQRVENYFDTIRSEILTLANSPATIAAMDAFSKTYFSEPVKNTDAKLANYYQNHFGTTYREKNSGKSPDIDKILNQLDPRSRQFQSDFIAHNPASLGNKDELLALPNPTEYSGVHQTYHPIFRQYLQEFGFYDIFLVDANTGTVVYSVFKELDYATSLKTGPYANSGLAKAYKNAVTMQKGQTYLTDFKPYFPSYDAEAAFIASPIVNNDGQTSGVLIFQMPVDRLNTIMTHQQNWKNSGLGDSGETYLVGDDFKMRSDGRFLIDDKPGYLATIRQSGMPDSIVNIIAAKNTTMGLQPVNTLGAKEALAGKTGFAIFPDYRGVLVFSAYQPLNIQGLNWALLSEIDESEAMNLLDLIENTTVRSLILLIVIAAIISAFISWLIARALTKPINDMLVAVKSLSSGKGDLRIRLEDRDNNDELSQLARGVNTFINYLDSTFSKLLGSVTRMKPISEDVKDINDILNKHSSQTKDQYDHIQQRLTEVLASNQNVDSKLNQIKDSTNSAVKEVATGRESVQQTVKEMGVLTAEITDVSGAVVELKQHSDEIVRIVDVIKDIAEQTNLLALNASIEAARAGEMGRGFAVVADEVRALAARTRTSTEDVTKMVNTISASTTHVEKIMSQGLESTQSCAAKVELTEKTWGDIESVMANIDDHVQEIGHSILAQMNELSGLSENFSHMDHNFEETQRSIDLCNHVSEDITKMGLRLKGLTDSFSVTDSNHSDKRRSQVRINE